MKKFLSLLCTLVVIVLLFGSIPVYAHSGRTDSSGGHNDNKNKSGLGPYHYHHGYGPHLHDGGICPYSPKDSITVKNFPNVMQIGTSNALDWEVVFYAGNGAVSWSSSNPQVVTVNSSGVLYAVGIGSATITATLANGSQSFSVTVQPIYAEEISLMGAVEELEVGKNQQLEGSVLPVNATDKDIAWSSSNPAIATVSPAGNVQAISPGTVTISASTSNGVTATHTFTIFEILPEDILLSETMVQLPLFTEKEIQATLVPANVTKGDLVWTSDNENIVTVKNGVLYGANVGTATIHISCQTVTKELAVSVYEVKPETLTLAPNDIRIEVGKTEAVQVLMEPAAITNMEILWEVADPSIAKLDDGILTALSLGTTELTARCQDLSASVIVEVFDVPVQTIRFANSSGYITKVYRLSPGENIPLEIEVLPENTSYPAAVLHTEDETVAQIKDGQLVAVGEGTTILYASAGQEETSIEVIVSKTNDSVITPLVIILGIGLVIVGCFLLLKKSNRIR